MKNRIADIFKQKSFIRSKLLLLVLMVVLELYYRFLIVPEYTHLGFRYNFNGVHFLISQLGLLALFLISWLLYNWSQFLYTIYLLLIFFFYIPNAILFAFAGGEYAPFLSNLFFVSSFVLSAYIPVKLPVFGKFNDYSTWIILGLSLMLILPIVYTYRSSINLNTLLLKDIYETRDVFSAKLSGLVNYFYHISVKTILPVALIFFMIRKKPVYIVLYFFILLYLFVISGNKFVYFTSIILVYFYYIGKDYQAKIQYIFLFNLLLFMIFPLLDYGFIKAEKPILAGTFVNRFLFIPALLTQWYFDFFDGKPFYFAESHFFNQFVKSPYDMPVGFLISKTYLNTTDTYANNGIVSDGFMNLGYWGVGLFSLVFSALFAVFNSLKLHVGYYGLFFSYIYMILSAPLLSCFITGGILLFIFLAIFILREKEHL